MLFSPGPLTALVSSGARILREKDGEATKRGGAIWHKLRNTGSAPNQSAASSTSCVRREPAEVYNLALNLLLSVVLHVLLASPKPEYAPPCAAMPEYGTRKRGEKGGNAENIVTNTLGAVPGHVLSNISRLQLGRRSFHLSLLRVVFLQTNAGAKREPA